MGAVIAFASPTRRRPRPVVDRDEPMGAILLFTGVRYERSAEADAGGDEPSSPRKRAHGRRRGTSRHG